MSKKVVQMQDDGAIKAEYELLKAQKEAAEAEAAAISHSLYKAHQARRMAMENMLAAEKTAATSVFVAKSKAADEAIKSLVLQWRNLKDAEMMARWAKGPQNAEEFKQWYAEIGYLEHIRPIKLKSHRYEGRWTRWSDDHGMERFSFNEPHKHSEPTMVLMPEASKGVSIYGALSDNNSRYYFAFKKGKVVGLYVMLVVNQYAGQTDFHITSVVNGNTVHADVMTVRNRAAINPVADWLKAVK